jgi:hypothetical protein
VRRYNNHRGARGGIWYTVSGKTYVSEQRYEREQRRNRGRDTYLGVTVCQPHGTRAVGKANEGWVAKYCTYEEDTSGSPSYIPCQRDITTLSMRSRVPGKTASISKTPPTQQYRQAFSPGVLPLLLRMNMDGRSLACCLHRATCLLYCCLRRSGETVILDDVSIPDADSSFPGQYTHLHRELTASFLHTEHIARRAGVYRDPVRSRNRNTRRPYSDITTEYITIVSTECPRHERKRLSLQG